MANPGLTSVEMKADNELASLPVYFKDGAH